MLAHCFAHCALRFDAAGAHVSASPSRSQGDWDFALVGAPPQGLLASPTREAALLLYAGGFSPGVFGLSVAERLPTDLVQVQRLQLLVRPSQPRAEVVADVALLGGAQLRVRVRSQLAAESAVRLRETWQELALNDTVNPVQLPANLQYRRVALSCTCLLARVLTACRIGRASRRLFVRYLDETMAVLRDESGAPTILVRDPRASVAAAAPPASAPQQNGPAAPDAHAPAANGASVVVGEVVTDATE